MSKCLLHFVKVKKMVEIKLKVEEARRSDVGRQIARISSEIADELGVKTGDVIEITGRRSTCLLYTSPSPRDS